jgi:cobalt-zinc-cadmium efflux system protein
MGSGRGGGHAQGHQGVLAPAAGAVPRLAVVLGITLTVLIVEVIGAFVSGSLALLADAGHMLTDVAGLSLAVVAGWLVGRPATAARTWGFQRAEVLSAAAQAAVLLAVGGYVIVEGVRRLVTAPEVASGAMIVFGVVGLVGNLISLSILYSGRGASMNTRAAFLEVANDALGSAAVLVAAVVIALTGWDRADAIASLLIGALILPRTWRLLRESVDVLLESTPKDLDLSVVREHVLRVSHVVAVHDVHASQVATHLPTFSAHVVVDEACFHDGHLKSLLDDIQGCLAGHFDVEHSTIQFEPASHAAHEPARHD